MQLPPNALTADIAQLEDMQKWSKKAVQFWDGADYTFSNLLQPSSNGTVFMKLW
jgi:hypothetical protein